MQALLRKANLASQMAIERKEKQLLFDGGTESRRRLVMMNWKSFRLLSSFLTIPQKFK